MRIDGKAKTAAGVILITSTLLAAGCGGAGGGSSTTTAKASASARSSASAGGNAVAGSGAFCATANKNLKGARATFPRDLSDAGQLKRYGQYIKTADAAARSVAPPEIAADVRLTTRASDAIADAYYLKGKPPTAAALGQLTSPQVAAALKRETQYTKAHCQVTP